jgi:hypothetical protein
MTATRRRLLSAAIPLAFAGALALPSPAAAAPVTVAEWNFDEATGASTAGDSTRNGYSAVVDPRYRNVRFGGYDSTLRSRVVFMDNGLLRAPSTPALVPGTRDVTITVQVKTSYAEGFSNFFQKGTYTTNAGFWKIEMSRGYGRCRFTGNIATVGFEGGPKINDGRWHTITCKKTAGSVLMYVDGVLVKRRNVVVGSITNTEDIAIGGKYLKNGGVVDPHDMLHGYLNLARYQLG